MCRSLAETLTKKNKTSNVKAFMVKNYLSVFVNAMIENPAFDSQACLSLCKVQAACAPGSQVPAALPSMQQCWPQLLHNELRYVSLPSQPHVLLS